MSGKRNYKTSTSRQQNRRNDKPKRQRLTNTAHTGEQSGLDEDSAKRWTELTAVGHMLADQVHMYMAENRAALSSGEQRQLSAWEGQVQSELDMHSESVLENVDLVSQLRQSHQNVSNTRDDLVVLRVLTRHVREETAQLEEQFQETTKYSTVRLGASRLLFALENFGNACRREADSTSGAPK